jgi:hypothetical protein
MSLKNKEKISIIVPIIVCILCLCSCSKKTPDEKLTDSFLEYSLGKTDGKFNRVFTTSNGTEMVVSELQKEDATSPKVILSVDIGNTDFKNQIYQWITSPVNVRMDDYRECAEMVIKYAKNENWDNDYYLYVNTRNIYGSCDIVYDYEKDMIYIPNAENTYKEMYEQFGTFYTKDITEADNGSDFIINNNLGYWQHNELETKDATSYSIFLHDGKFSEYEKDKSTVYSRDDVSE